MNFKKNTKIISTVMTCLVIVAVLCVNLLVSILGAKIDLNIDLTKSQLLKLSDLTKETIDSLETDVRIMSLIPENAAEKYGDAYGIYDAMDRLLKKYDSMSSKITYEVIDTEKDPTVFQRYKDATGNDATEDSIIFETDEKYKVVDIASVASLTNNMVLFGGEQLFTSAIDLVTGGEEQIIYVSEGHNESAPAAYIAQLFSGQPFAVKSLNLMEEVPDDASLVMILSPENDFLAQEIDNLDKYISNGGNAIIAGANNINASTANLNEFYAEYGISYSDAYVSENSAENYFNGNKFYILPNVENTEITEAIYKNDLRVATFVSQSIDVTNAKNVEVQTILSSSSDSVLSYIKNSDDTASLEDGSEKGPFTLAALATKNYDEGYNSKLLFLGNSMYINPTLAEESGFANKDFIINSTKYLTGSSSLLSIGPKDLSTPMLAIDAAEQNLLMILVIGVIPVVILIGGFIVWIRRKHL